MFLLERDLQPARPGRDPPALHRPSRDESLYCLPPSGEHLLNGIPPTGESEMFVNPPLGEEETLLLAGWSPASRLGSFPFASSLGLGTFPIFA